MQIARAAGPAVRRAVLGYRGFRLPRQATRRRLLVPDAMAKVMIGLGDPVRVRPAVGGEPEFVGASLFNPASATASIGEHLGRIEGITVLLHPLAAYQVFGPVVGDLEQRPATLDDLLPGAGNLVDRLARLADWEARFRLLDQAFAARLDAGPLYAPEVRAAWELLSASNGRVPTKDLATETGWSVRRLQRRFNAQIGLAPQAAGAVFRLQRALRLHAQGASWGQAAADAGFYDQPQFNRTFRAMVGRSPGQFFDARRDSEPGDAKDFLPGQVTSTLLTG